MVNAQEWLDKNYPVEKRSEIKELNISRKNLRGRLQIKGFYNLKELNCSENKLNILDISELKNLTSLCCNFNQLVHLDTSSCKEIIKFICSDNIIQTDLSQLIQEEWKDKLNWLTIANNRITGNINCLEGFSKIELLHINNNQLNGSLKSCQAMKKLKGLWIANTNISEGLKYLRNLSIAGKELEKEFNVSGTSFQNILQPYETLNDFFEYIDSWTSKLQENDNYWRVYSHLKLSDKIIDIYEQETQKNRSFSPKELKKQAQEKILSRSESFHEERDDWAFVGKTTEKLEKNQQWIQASFTNNDKTLITFLQAQGYQSPQQALKETKGNIDELRNKHQKYLEYKSQIEVILKPN